MAASPGRAADPAQGTDPVYLETGPSTGITVRLAEDLASLADDSTGRRVIPVVGEGGVQNLADLLAGRDVDMAFVQLDALEYARTQKLFPNLETRISYIAKLNYVEFHLLARSNIAGVDNLTGKVVDVGPVSGDTVITAARLFRLLNISPVLSDDEPAAAIVRLRRGEVDAVAFVGGKPAPLLRLADTEGLHLLPIPLTADVVAAYVPTRFSATDYPGLVPTDGPVDTVAVGTGLFVGPAPPESDEYRKLAVLVDMFFSQFRTLLAPGHDEKWSEVNLSSLIPGWQRFPAADEWLKRNAAVAEGQDLRMIFMKYLDERAKITRGQQLSPEQKEALFDQFRHWQNGQDGQRN
jgi:TRAP-type uncharacterized transport system substrate-binding protein